MWTIVGLTVAWYTAAAAAVRRWGRAWGADTPLDRGFAWVTSPLLAAGLVVVTAGCWVLHGVGSALAPRED